MPLNINVVQILLHMLNFVILAGGLTLILFKPVSKFLAERKEYFEKIEKENAEKAEENERLKAEYETKLVEAKEEIAALRQQSEKEAADAAKSYIDSAKEQAALIIKNAEKDAEERKSHILDSAQTEISELVIEATQKLLSDTASEDRSRALYDEFIAMEGKASK